jgi:glycogen operon protein
VIECRERRKRSLMATLLLSQGVPMILGGDELSHTRRGNNNPYCQDNEITWYDWDLDEREEEFFDFVKQLTRFRREHPSFRRRHFLSDADTDEGTGDVLWWHPAGRPMEHDDWSDDDLRGFGYLLRGELPDINARGETITDDAFLVLMNQDNEPMTYTLPEETNELDDKTCQSWTLVPELAEMVDADGPFAPGETLELGPHLLVALKAER